MIKRRQGIMISCMPHNSRFHRKLTKEVTQVQCWNGTQKRGHKKANDLSHEIKGPKDATKQNGVYKFNCSECKSWYFGETGQRMEKRTYQHKNDVKNSKEINAILMHLQEHNMPIPSNGKKFSVLKIRKTGRREN